LNRGSAYAKATDVAGDADNTDGLLNFLNPSRLEAASHL